MGVTLVAVITIITILLVITRGIVIAVTIVPIITGGIVIPVTTTIIGAPIERVTRPEFAGILVWLASKKAEHLRLGE